MAETETDDLRAFVRFWRRHGQKRIQIESGVGSTFEDCTGSFGGCCSTSFDFGGLYDALVALGGWTADTDHEHRWGSPHGVGWRLCEVKGCRMFLPAQETLDSWPEGEEVPLQRLPDDYDKKEDDPCPA